MLSGNWYLPSRKQHTAFDNAFLINGMSSIKTCAASKHKLFPDRDPASADILD
jgi:hypothetical protein